MGSLNEGSLRRTDISEIPVTEMVLATAEHHMTLHSFTVEYEIREGRLFHPSSGLFLDQVINPPDDQHAKNYVAIPDDVIARFRDAETALTSGERTEVALLFPDTEDGRRAMTYLFRREGDKVHVICVDSPSSVGAR